MRGQSGKHWALYSEDIKFLTAWVTVHHFIENDLTTTKSQVSGNITPINFPIPF